MCFLLLGEKVPFLHYLAKIQIFTELPCFMLRKCYNYLLAELI